MTRWRAFLASALVTLFCLVPLYLLVIGGSLFGAEPAETAADGVPILTPTPQDSLTLLLVVEDAEPSAALVRLDAWQRRAECLLLPSDTLLEYDDRTLTLEQCMEEAGPLQLHTALQQMTGGSCERYLCLRGEQLAGVFDEFSPVVSWDDLGHIHDLALLRRFAFNGGQGALASNTAAILLRRCEGDAAEKATLRCALYTAFLQEGLTALREPVGRLLRQEEGLLTDISAVDFYGIERLLDLLAADVPAVACQVVSGRETARGLRLEQEGLAQLRALLDLPAESDTAAVSEPPAVSGAQPASEPPSAASAPADAA